MNDAIELRMLLPNSLYARPVRNAAVKLPSSLPLTYNLPLSAPVPACSYEKNNFFNSAMVSSGFFTLCPTVRLSS
jgi:hypothetical protein